MKNRIISLILVLIMVFSMMSMPAFAENALDVGSLLGGAGGLLGGGGSGKIDYTELLLSLLESGAADGIAAAFGNYITGLIGGDLTVECSGDSIVFPGQQAVFKAEVPKTISNVFAEYSYIWIDVTYNDIDLDEIMDGELSAVEKLGSKVLSTTDKLVIDDIKESDDGKKFACIAFKSKGRGLSFGMSPTMTLTVLPLTECTHTVLKPVNGIEPTCTEAGNVPYFECTICGNLFLDRYAETVTTPELVVIPATGHTTVGGIRVEPTCTENGHTEGGTCIYCNQVIEEQLVLVAKGHIPNILSAEILPTCTDAGISAQIVCSVCGETLQEAEELPAKGHDFHGAKCSTCGTFQSNPFVDINDKDYYFEPVLWAVYSNPQVTQGTDKFHFSPASFCTRGQVVTFLWRAAGCPEPMLKVSPFTDVTIDDYFYKAVLWAYERGITTGITNTEFAPYRNVTRAQFVTFLWRYQGEPEPTDISSPFADVQDPFSPFYMAILWAAETGVTTGRTIVTFAPNDICTRANVVTFIFRSLGDK